MRIQHTAKWSSCAVTGTHRRRQVGLGRGGHHDLIQAASSGEASRESDAALWRKREWHQRLHTRMTIDATPATLLPAARTLHRVSTPYAWGVRSAGKKIVCLYYVRNL